MHGPMGRKTEEGVSGTPNSGRMTTLRIWQWGTELPWASTGWERKRGQELLANRVTWKWDTEQLLTVFQVHAWDGSPVEQGDRKEGRHRA